MVSFKRPLRSEMKGIGNGNSKGLSKGGGVGLSCRWDVTSWTHNNLLCDAYVIWTWLGSCKFHVLSLKMKFVTRKKGQGKWSIISCHSRLGMEPQTRNRGARQGHDLPAIPLSAIIIKSTFFCLPLKVLLKKSLSGKKLCTRVSWIFLFCHSVSLLHHHLGWWEPWIAPLQLQYDRKAPEAHCSKQKTGVFPHLGRGPPRELWMPSGRQFAIPWKDFLAHKRKGVGSWEVTKRERVLRRQIADCALGNPGPHKERSCLVANCVNSM